LVIIERVWNGDRAVGRTFPVLAEIPWRREAAGLAVWAERFPPRGAELALATCRLQPTQTNALTDFALNHSFSDLERKYYVTEQMCRWFYSLLSGRYLRDAANRFVARSERKVGFLCPVARDSVDVSVAASGG
jgi:hypothetical protein